MTHQMPVFLSHCVKLGDLSKPELVRWTWWSDASFTQEEQLKSEYGLACVITTSWVVFIPASYSGSPRLLHDLY